MRGCGFPSRDSDSTDRLRHLARDLVWSALSPGLDGALADGVRRALEASAAPNATPREARYALARQVGRQLRWVPGQPPVGREVRERACLLLAVLARVDRQEYERHGIRVPAESSLAEMRRWVTAEGIDRKVSALLREAEVGGLGADDFCNRVEGLIRGMEAARGAAQAVCPSPPPAAPPRPAPAAGGERPPVALEEPAVKAESPRASLGGARDAEPGRPLGEGEGGAKPQAPMRPEDVALTYLAQAVRAGRPVPSRTECAEAAGVTKQATMKWDLFSRAWRSARKTEKRDVRRGYRDARTGDVEAEADDDG